MDESSQKTVAFLDAISAAIEQLAGLGDGLFRKTRPYTALLPGRTMLVGVGDFKSIRFGCGLFRDESMNRSINFGVVIRWTASEWLIQSLATADDVPPNPIQTSLWSSPEYSATTIDDAVRLLQAAVRELIASADEPRVAECLATIVPMH